MPVCSAQHAAVGARTIKSGQSKWFVGYKKHSLRLWFSKHNQSVLLVPLMCWTAPANRGDVLFLEPSLKYLQKHLDFTPWLVIGDMAYIKMATQKKLREQLHVGVLTHLPPNYDIPQPLRAALLMQCRHGQRLRWLGLRQDEQLHWFGVDAAQEFLCQQCWEQSVCPQEFSFHPSDHEIVLGTVPINTRLGKRLLRQSRSWIEAAQAYEKIQLGLSSMFLNSLRLASIACLLSDTVCLLRAHALCSRSGRPDLLEELRPVQLAFNLD
jgi:hypothetical protein